MSTIKIYHNPSCSTSRKVLDLIRENGFEPTVIQYLKTPPERETLVALIQKMGVSVRDILRERGTPYAELGLDDAKWTDDQLIDFIVEHPILLNRPIVDSDRGAKLCRPIESVLELLPSK
ncbi:arsenate reductase (glutaredoxin) [Orrella marina]|uniref:Arsenate reductase n=1 Tax=Orrella marina TaxID=2163011 RepID=A0A2R4XGM3_9BURK|nr:arsenate reductase (glutaredoxin) [Orrella marina]AWB32972.1 arsenate reductase (glutaredoxin) [Orrella marina]